MKVQKQWHSLPKESLFQELNSSESGLNENEVKKRLQIYGYNSLQGKSSETIPHILLRQLHNPIVYVLLFSTGFAVILGKYADSLVVFSVVVLNTLIGFIQEYKAHRIIKALTSMMPHKTTVIRDKNQKLIPSSHVVPGDIVFLQSGDKIPADLRLFSIKNLQCDESTLTGESLPVAKHIETLPHDTPIPERKCMAFSGTYVTAGTGFGIVVATGLKTEFGKISELIEQVVPLETPLSLALKKIAGWISSWVMSIGVLLFVIGYLRGSSLFDSGLAAMALAVAAIPEGLPAIITIASAIGVRRMAKRQAIVRQLPAVEALGSTTIICTDKTGTLTHNEMTVQRILTHSGFSFVTGSGFSLEGHVIPQKGVKNQVIQEEVIPLLTMAILCSDATLDQSEIGWVPVGDPTEVALVVAGRKVNLQEDDVRSKWERKDVIPFESEKRLMATLNISPEKKEFIFLKGAPEEILLRCNADEATQMKLLKKVDEMAMEGMRVLAFAEKEPGSHLDTINEEDLKDGFAFLGFIGMIDPPRKEVHKAIKCCHEAGIKVKMVTGDHPITARAIGRDLGLLIDDQEIITGKQLSQLKPHQWKEIALKYNVFARVSPEHKLKLVSALQEQGHVVAMTGDGVNDSAALKRADIGIAMGIKGTAVAKEASDMILADDNFASIEAAVEEGRRVYDNLIKALAFILPTSLGQALVILIAVFFFPVRGGELLHPMLPVQILWINLVVAVALSLPLAFEVQEPDIMHRPPRKKKAPILSRFILFRTLTVSILMAFGIISLFLWEYNKQIDNGVREVIALAEAQTMAVTAMILFQIVYLFNCRSLTRSNIRIGFFSNHHVFIGVSFVFLAQIAFVYLPIMNKYFRSSPLDLEAWMISFLVAILMIPFVALEKWFSRD